MHLTDELQHMLSAACQSRAAVLNVAALSSVASPLGTHIPPTIYNPCAHVKLLLYSILSSLFRNSTYSCHQRT